MDPQPPLLPLPPDRFIGLKMKSVSFIDSLFEECYFEDVTSSNTFFKNCTFLATVFYNTGDVPEGARAAPRRFWVGVLGKPPSSLLPQLGFHQERLKRQPGIPWEVMASAGQLLFWPTEEPGRGGSEASPSMERQSQPWASGGGLLAGACKKPSRESPQSSRPGTHGHNQTGSWVGQGLA